MEPEGQGDDRIRSQQQRAFQPVGTSILDKVVDDQHTGEQNDGLKVLEEQRHGLVDGPAGKNQNGRDQKTNLQRR